MACKLHLFISKHLICNRNSGKIPVSRNCLGCCSRTLVPYNLFTCAIIKSILRYRRFPTRIVHPTALCTTTIRYDDDSVVAVMGRDPIDGGTGLFLHTDIALGVYHNIYDDLRCGWGHTDSYLCIDPLQESSW